MTSAAMSPMGGMSSAMSPTSMSGKTVTATAAATPSLSILVEALTKANLTGAPGEPPVYQGLRVYAELPACRPSALHQEKLGSSPAEQN